LKGLKGVFAVTFTSFKDNEDLDEETLRLHLDFLVESGVHGVIPNGTTGEFASLSEAERKKNVEITIDEINGRIPVVCCTSENSTRETMMLAKHAEDAGADGLMILTPYYCRPNEEEVFEHFKAVGEAVNIPIMIYNNPWTTGVDIKPELVARLAKIDNICCIKEASAQLERVHQIIDLCGEDMTVFCGWETISLESFMHGAKGWVAACANVIPKECVELFSFVESGKIKEALRLYYKIMPFLRFTVEREIPRKKASLELLGHRIGSPRRPLLPADGQEKKILKKCLLEIGLV